jgi:hypothetical protein
MPSLVFYRDEREVYDEAFALKVTDEEAIIIVKKLCRHFMKIPKGRKVTDMFRGSALRKPRIRFYGNRQSGCVTFGWRIDLRLSHNPSLGVICHEVGHIVERYTRKPRKCAAKHKNHSKRLMKIVGKLIKYAMSKNLWRS